MRDEVFVLQCSIAKPIWIVSGYWGLWSCPLQGPFVLAWPLVFAARKLNFTEATDKL